MKRLSKVRRVSCILLLFLCNYSIYSQSHTYKHYGVEEGLPSSEVYSAFQDSKGYMWFATDAGVSRFNGYEFKNFDVSDGLTDNTVFLITEDSKERIWFGTFNCQLSYYDYAKDSIYPYKYNKVLKDSLTGKSTIISFNVDSEGNVWMGFNHKGLKKITPNGYFYNLSSSQERDKGRLDIIKLNEKNIYGMLINNEELRSLDIFYSNQQAHLRQQNYIVNYYEKKNYIGKLYITSDKDINLIIIPNTRIFYHDERRNILKKIRLSKDLNKIAIHSLFYENEFLYLCGEKGIYQCEIKSDSLSVQNHFLKDLRVVKIYKDIERGYWITTLENGLYYFPSFLMFKNSMTSLINDKNKVKRIIVDQEDNLFFVTKKEGLYKQNLLTNKIQHFISFNIPNYYVSLSYDLKQEQMILEINNNVFSYKNKKLRQLTFNKRYSGRIILADSNRTYSAGGRGLVVLEDKKEIYRSSLRAEELFYTSLMKNGGEVWAGTSNGIRIYKDKKIRAPFQEDPILSRSITSIERLNKELFLIGTKSYGLLVMQKDSILEIINQEKGLVSDLVRKIHVDNQGVIWVGTNKGISKIDYQKYNKYEVFNLTKKHGLLSEEMIDICSYKNTIYAATPKGLLQFDKTKIIPNVVPPTIHITGFKVNSINRELELENTFTHEENFITIDYEGLNYRSLGEVEYQYRMLGVDTNWISTKTRNIQFQTLQPNDYQFEVKAKNEDGYWSKPKTVSFTIDPPFWLTWWFISLEVLLGIGIILVIFWYREKQIRQKSTAEKRMVELELKALRSQMNPHFIFNILNSIQHYIIINDFKKTNRYITQFAKLIRTVLHVSEKSVIAIQEEVDMLTLYMELERMRFDEQFSYTIDVSDEIDLNYDEIPSMLIQPYVENSIWHGLMNKTKKGEIKIRMYIEASTLFCTVEDNGIGREKSAEIKSKRKIEQKSVGMSITKERLDLINENKVNVRTIDLKDKEGVSLGTKIEIKIPYSA